MRKVTGEARKPKTMGKENIWISGVKYQNLKIGIGGWYSWRLGGWKAVCMRFLPLGSPEGPMSSMFWRAPARARISSFAGHIASIYASSRQS